MPQTTQVLASSGSQLYRPGAQAATGGSGDGRSPARSLDAGMAQAGQLRSMAAATPNPLDTVPTAMIPSGSSRFNAKGKLGIFSRSFGLTNVTRSATEIDVSNPKATATIKDDPSHPGMVDVSINMSGNQAGNQFYQGTLQASSGGFTANTTDGKRLTFMQHGSEIDIKAAGFPQVPGNATLILTRA